MAANLKTGANLIGMVLYSGQPGAGTTTVYTCPAATTTKLTQGSLCNTTSAAVTVSLSLHQAGQAVDGTHRVINNYVLAANDTLPLADYLGGHMLGPGDFVSVVLVAGVSVVLSGAEGS